MPTSRSSRVEDPPVFPESEADAAAPSAGAHRSDFSTVHDESRRTGSTREPVSSEQPFADDSAEANGGPVGRRTYQQILDRVVITDDGPVENLPRLVSPELKLIGRCVALRVRQRINGSAPVNFYYTGLVSTVSATTVTLMHVNRYTHADFKAYKAREKELRSERLGQSPHDAGRDWARSFDASDVVAGTQDTVQLQDMSAAGSLAPAVVLTTEAELSVAEEAEKRQGDTDAWAAGRTRPRHFRTFADSVGPIPYVTLLRKGVYDVEFGRDPRSAFYSIFQDPLRAITDMQFLRMFVRRYLVHTSESSNPLRLPIYAFLSVHLHCATLDHELVKRLVRQELLSLMHADSGLWTASSQRPTLRSAGDPLGLESPSPVHHLTPAGLLFVSSLLRVTYSVGILIIGVGVLFAVYLGAALGPLDESLIVDYILGLLGHFIPAVLVWVLAGICIVTHCRGLHIPRGTQLETPMMRTLFSVGAVGCAIMILVVCAGRLQDYRMVAAMNSASPSDLCAFYKKYECTGFVSNCTNSTAEMCSSCARTLTYADACAPYVRSRVRMLLIPLLAFGGVAGVLTLLSLYLLWKLLVTVNGIGNHTRRAGVSF